MVVDGVFDVFDSFFAPPFHISRSTSFLIPANTPVYDAPMVGSFLDGASTCITHGSSIGQACTHGTAFNLVGNINHNSKDYFNDTYPDPTTYSHMFPSTQAPYELLGSAKMVVFPHSRKLRDITNTLMICVSLSAIFWASTSYYLSKVCCRKVDETELWEEDEEEEYIDDYNYSEGRYITGTVEEEAEEEEMEEEVSSEDENIEGIAMI